MRRIGNGRRPSRAACWRRGAHERAPPAGLRHCLRRRVRAVARSGPRAGGRGSRTPRARRCAARSPPRLPPAPRRARPGGCRGRPPAGPARATPRPRGASARPARPRPGTRRRERAGRFLLRRGGQSFEPVLAHRLQHAERGFRVLPLFPPEQALVDERRERARTSRPGPSASPATASAASRVQPAGEDGEAAEEAVRSGVEQVVAPGDRVAHRSQPGGLVARPAVEQRQAAVEAGQQGCRREDAGPGRPPARSPGAGRPTGGRSRPRSRRWPRSRRKSGRLLARAGRRGGPPRTAPVRRRSRPIARRPAVPAAARGSRARPETRSAARLVTSSVKPRTGGQQLGDERRRGDHLLEVVEHQQQAPVAEECLRNRSSGRTPGDVRHAERLRHGRGDQGRVADRRERDKAVPSANSSANSAATWIASRVLPTPPGPVRVSRRTSGRRSNSRMAASSRSRPTSGVRGSGGGVGACSRRTIGARGTSRCSERSNGGGDDIGRPDLAADETRLHDARSV